MRACPAPVINGSTATVTCRYIKNVGAQYWTVPAEVTEATFTLYGGAGAGPPGTGGNGAEVTGTLPVTPGSVLQVNVARAGKNTGGAFGGGGPGGWYGGGGASDIRDGAYTLADRLLVAGGGGGSGGPSSDGPGGVVVAGGAGGAAGSPGEAGASALDFCGETVPGGGGGGAGTATMGGAGGAGNTPGTPCGPGSGGVGGSAGTEGSGGAGSDNRGGGGGGGYYGGGGGGGNTFAPSPVSGGGGGGGGSSYTGTATNASVNDDPASPPAGPMGEVIITYAEALTSHTLTGRETAVSCLSASLCVAVGSRHGHGVVVTLSGGAQSRALVLRGSSVLDSVSCGPSGCWAIGRRDRGGGAYLVKISSAGLPVRERTVAVPAGASLGPISCASLTSCEIAGADNHIRPAAIEIGTWTGTRLHLHRVRVTGSRQVSMPGISCWHSDCEAVGNAQVAVRARNVLILPINGGKPGKLYDADNGYYITRVSCISAATCYASGGAYLYTVTDGVPADRQTIPDGGQNSLTWLGIECAGTVCEAAGEEIPGSAWVGVLLSLSDGTAGAPTFVDDSGGFTGIAGRSGTGLIAIGRGPGGHGTVDTIG
jgi:hypothetical protein